jgi:hypothetical protein
MNYYIYLHIKSTDLKPFYIGKGNGRRCFSKQSRSNHWNNIVNKHGYDIILIEENLTHESAIELEKYWIKRIGRKDLSNGPLVNLTDGGEGTANRPMTEKTKIALSQSNKNRIASKSQREIVGSMYKGKFGKEHNRSKSVRCIETGIIYGSMSEAGRILNINHSSVSWSIKYKRPIYGMHFEIAQ